MKLDKEDLKQIRGVVKTEVNSIIGGVEKQLEKKIDESAVKTKNEIITVLTREIMDLAEINRAVIQRVDKITELEKRIIRIEHKIGIATS